MGNTDRLISARELKERLSNLEASGGHKYYRKGMDDVLHYFMPKIIDDQPTVDAVEVVHGEWVVCGDGEYVPFMCSACGKTTSWYHAQTANYCPNCGAKMEVDAS